MKKKKIIIITLITILLIFFIILFFKFFLNNNYKNEKIGNNKSIEEIEQYILNIKTYKADMDVTIVNNRNENTYKITQEVANDHEKQVTQMPEEIKGLEMTYKDGKLEIKNTKLNLSKIYENYPNISENYLFLSQFIESYNSINERSISILDENTIIMEIKNNKSNYNVLQRLYVNKENLKPTKFEIIDNNNKIRVYILYNEIEINI